LATGAKSEFLFEKFEEESRRYGISRKRNSVGLMLKSIS
jgi:hypothetical protein